MAMRRLDLARLGSRPDPVDTWSTWALTLGLMLLASIGQAQVVEPFDIRYQTQQNGGIVFLANSTMYCGGGNNCTQTQQAMPSSNWSQDNNNDHNMVYYDGDNDPDTWCSSSDSLALGLCADISFAGLYWAGRLGNGFVPNESLRDQVKIRSADQPYIDIESDEEIEFDASNVDNYCCFADITDWMQQQPVNARVTVANVIADEDDSSWGGWVLILVYADALEPMRNLTVFDGLAMITSGWGGGGDNSTVDVDISGFLTPPLGPVDFQLGVVAYDGDRGSDGDQLGFNGTGGFEYISDATHPINNAFNSTHSTGGTMNPFRIPGPNNTLGHDANVFIPDNSGYDFLPNNTTDATIRVTTGGESITLHAITSSIDVYEPDLRATVYIEDLNGGVAEPGDILQYTVVGKNLGSDAAVDVELSKTLDLRTTYIPGTLFWLSGPLSGTMTDAEGDDEGEFLVDEETVRVRAGVGANAGQGGLLGNDPLGMDSVAFRFQVQLTDDCLLLQCDGTLTGVAQITGSGEISGNPQDNDGQSALVDANGCPVEAVTTLDVQTGVCPPVLIEPVGTTCLGSDIALEVPEFINNPIAESLANYTWTGPEGFSANTASALIENAQFENAGSYLLEVTFTGLECLLSTADFDLLVHQPAPQFTPPPSQCDGDNAFTFASSGAQFIGPEYTWSFDGGVPAAATGTQVDSIHFAESGWHSVTLTLDEIGCTHSITDSIFVEQTPTLMPFAVNVWPEEGCLPLTVNFADAETLWPLDYHWHFSDGTSSLQDTPAHLFTESGTFSASVDVVSIGNCPATLSFDLPQTITVYPPPQVGFEVEPTVVDLLTPIVDITSTAQENANVTYWMSDGGSLGSADGSYIFSNGGAFDIVQTVISPFGCAATATAEVVVNGTIFFAPSAFTPDGDGINDFWLPSALGVTEYHMDVYNRWGAVLWTSNDPERPWMGEVDGGTHFVPDGLYLWRVRYRDQIGFRHAETGTVQIIR